MARNLYKKGKNQQEFILEIYQSDEPKQPYLYQLLWK